MYISLICVILTHRLFRGKICHVSTNTPQKIQSRYVGIFSNVFFHNFGYIVQMKVKISAKEK